MRAVVWLIAVSFVCLPLCLCIRTPEYREPLPLSQKAVSTAIDSLIQKTGTEVEARIRQGVEQTARLWLSQDGDEKEFMSFCLNHFIGDPALLEQTFARLEKQIEVIDGHLHEIERELTEPFDLDIGPMLPIDDLFTQFSPGSHANDDFFKTRIAFVVLLNYPLTSLEFKESQGSAWSPLDWAKTRLAGRFQARVPATVQQRVNRAYTAANGHINSYNIFMHHILTKEGERLFPAGMRLLSHWNLRDEIRSQYKSPDGIRKQELILKIMEKIISQDIPAVVVDNPGVDWMPETGAVSPADVQDFPGVKPISNPSAERSQDERYARIIEIFNAERLLDPYFPQAPTYIERRFDLVREISEEEIETMLSGLMQDPVIARTARLIETRLGRPLKAFDIWYDGFRPKSPYGEEELDRIVSEKYPTAQAFEKDLRRLLTDLGFAPVKADFLASRVKVDPARGSGHAMGPASRMETARLRTRVGSRGMNYKGYSIAVHEFGHNCEQLFSTHGVASPSLNGVPNGAFTEAFAFVFQSRNLALLGLKEEDPSAAHLQALEILWDTYEISGSSLIDMRMWRWLYKNPDASPARLRQEVLSIAKDVWNDYYAPVFGVRDMILQAIYSHTVHYPLYLPDYALGHIMSFQIERYLEEKSLGTEMERMCRQGRITPGAWMRGAVGSGISVEPLIQAANEALNLLEGR